MTFHIIIFFHLACDDQEEANQLSFSSVIEEPSRSDIDDAEVIMSARQVRKKESGIRVNGQGILVLNLQNLNNIDNYGL